MSENIKVRWLVDNEQTKVAPKTFSTQILNEDGTHFKDTVEASISEIDEKIALHSSDSEIHVSSEEKESYATKEYVENLYKKLNSNTVLGFYCIEDVTVVTNGVPKVYPANSNVEIAFIEDDVFEIVPTSDSSILSLSAFPNALGTFYSWLEGVAQFSNILFDMNDEAMYSKWSQGNQGVYHVQSAQYTNCIFWSDNPYISDVSKRTNYTLTHTSQLPLCYSTIPDNTFKSFYLAGGVNSDPNWSNQAYKDSFAKANWATQVFSYYGARTVGLPGMFDIVLPKDCRGLMFDARNIENAGTFDATNTTNFGAKSGSWREAFGDCTSLRRLYIKNLKVSLNISWSPIDYNSISYIISAAANTTAITISVSPYTYNLLSQSDFELAASKNITIALLTTNYVEDRRLSAIDNKADTTYVDEKFVLKSDIENTYLSKYETKIDSQTKLDEAKAYTDTKTANIVTESAVDTKISTHNTSTDSHNDIRDLINGLTTRLNTLANSDDTTLDQMSEIVAYIKNNKDLIDGITTTKVNVADIIDNLTTNVINKPLSAAQGVVIKGLIDALQIEVDGKVPTSRTINGKELIENIVLSATDVGAVDSWNDLKDKPFEDNGEIITTIFTGRAQLESMGDGHLQKEGSYGQQANDLLLEVGQKYNVMWDGALYECTALSNGNYIYIGNASLSWDTSSNIDTSEPFCIFTTDGSCIVFWEGGMRGYKNVEISNVKRNLKTIDEKYIPDTIARVEDIPNNIVQTVNNIEPDENGNVEIEIPEGFSGSWNDLKDKPFSETQSAIILDTAFTITDKLEGYYLEKPLGLTSEHICTVIFDGIEYENMPGREFGNMWYIGGPDNGIPFTVSDYLEVIYADVGNHTIKIIQNYPSTIKTIDEKFIPNTIARTTELLQAVTATSDDGIAYTATVPGITGLTTGTCFVMIPSIVSATTAPTIDVNGLGARTICRKLSAGASIVTGPTETWLTKNRPVLLMYHGSAWIVVGLDQPVASDIYGLENILPKVTTVSIFAENWTGDKVPYSQVVTVNGVTENSKVDLQPTAHQIVELQESDIALMTRNTNGEVTVYALGGKPTSDYTMQILITETVTV